jgi:hypothetical protein
MSGSGPPLPTWAVHQSRQLSGVHRTRCQRARSPGTSRMRDGLCGSATAGVNIIAARKNVQRIVRPHDSTLQPRWVPAVDAPFGRQGNFNPTTAFVRKRSRLVTKMGRRSRASLGTQALVRFVPWSQLALPPLRLSTEVMEAPHRPTLRKKWAVYCAFFAEAPRGSSSRACLGDGRRAQPDNA